MKKVRYALGAIGAMPIVAMAMPTAALGAVSHSPKSKSKSVALPNRDGSAIRACTGHTQYNNAFAGFDWGNFYTRNGGRTCIGTVSMSDQVHADTSWRIRIYSGANHTRVVNHTQSKSNSHYGVHKSYNDPVQLCWTTFFGGGSIDFQSCHTFG